MKPKIVLLDLTKQPCDIFTDIFTQCGYHVLSSQSLVDVSSWFTSHSISYFVVNVNLPHPSLLKQIHSVAIKHSLPVVMFAKSSDKSLTEQAIQSGINALVVDGFDVNRLRHVMDIAKARFDETQRLNNELQKLKFQLAERKTMDKAKGILMKQRAIDEITATELIRKMALDRNQNLTEVARSIVDVDELLI
ncbi:MAG: ANTAR domain-containing protein [Gammaproteobacteria bacterium]|nr:ANTAR domain-containing protein [Gammaproteobacteria bacterium]